MKNKLTVFDDEQVKNISSILISVYNLLSEKAMFEMMAQDELNKTVLGGVGFFFKKNDDTSYLCYDKHPKYWNETHIKRDIEEYRRYILREKGVYIEE